MRTFLPSAGRPRLPDRLHRPGWPPAVALVLSCLLMALVAPPARADGIAFIVRPVPGAVAKAFDGPAKPWLPGHRGVDLTASEGTPVRSPADGVVSFASVVVDRPVVSVRHADVGGRTVVTSYEPVTPAVHVGQRVRAGDVLGWISLGGHCSQACLHWGLRVGGQYVDPMGWLAASVRLLPSNARATVLPPASPAPAPPMLMPPTAGAGGGPGALGGVRPAQGPITSGFGMRYHPVLHVWKLHDGTDIGAACGAPVSAVWAGIVVSAQPSIGWGNRIVIDHGLVGSRHLRTTYNHLSAFGVRPGQRVAQGQFIGRVGTTGYSTGCHLHLGLELNGHLVDPLSVVGWR